MRKAIRFGVLEEERGANPLVRYKLGVAVQPGGDNVVAVKGVTGDRQEPDVVVIGDQVL
jgi:hypothetical protein